MSKRFLSVGNKNCILYIPGSSGLDNPEWLAQIAVAAEAAGFAFTPLRSWSNRAELETKTVNAIRHDIDEAIRAIQETSDAPIYVIAKSFGGGMMLLKNREAVERMVLWAPAIGVSETVADPASFENVPLKELDSIFSIQTDATTLASITAPVCFIRGMDDSVVPQSLMDTLAGGVPHAEILGMEGMGHTAMTGDQLAGLLRRTLAFFA